MWMAVDLGICPSGGRLLYTHRSSCYAPRSFNTQLQINVRTHLAWSCSRGSGDAAIGGEPREAYEHAAVPRAKEEPHRAVQNPRRRYRLARSANRALVRADQWADRSLQDASKGSPLTPRAADADRQAAGVARISPQEEP